MHFVIILLIMVSAFLGPYFFVFVPQLHVVRFAPALFLCLSAILNCKVRLAGAPVTLFWFFTVYFGYTLVISLFHIADVGLNNIVNFLVLILFVYSLFLSTAIDPYVFLKAMRVAVTLFVVAALILSFYEELTLSHLKLSTMVAVPQRWPESHFPTTFFTNPNDFAAIFTFSSMFLLTFVEEEQERTAKWFKVFLLMLSWLWVISTTESRINFISFFVFLFFYLKLWRPAPAVAICVFVILAVLIFPEILVKLENHFASLFDYTITTGESLSERWTLINYGIRSILDSNTLGFGAGSSQVYYSQFVGNGLTGRTLDPHNYVLEILINSGLWMLVLYLAVSILILYNMVVNGINRLAILQFVLYNFVLLSSSSSLFLWPHYIFFVAYVTYGSQLRQTTDLNRDIAN